MKISFTLLLLMLVTFSCQKDFGPLTSKGHIVALSQGNVFYYYEYSASFADSIGILADYYIWNEVRADTIIQAKKYFVLNYSTFERADESRLYAFVNGHEIVELNYDVEIGDMVEFNQHRVVVANIQTKPVFVDRQTIITVSNKAMDSDSLITGSYASKFGLLSFAMQHGSSSHGSMLSGAIINQTEYGVIHR